jgi:hypothetical protein
MLGRYVTKTSLVALAILLGATFGLPQKTQALSGSQWKPGRIIDDGIFFNKNSMSVSQIQTFLNKKVPVCDRNNPYKGWVNGKYIKAPYTCLKEYNENTTTKVNNIGKFTSDGKPVVVSGGKSAARIIWDAAQTYGINPQVLIVMLEKETSIVTDPWSAEWQYDRAMGYACPDSGPGNTANCDTSYYGFYNQVVSAAWQLKRYTTHPDEFNFKAGVNRYIQYSPNVSCGGKNVYLENKGTAALYNYTPYQPNAGALSNLYGTANCGAYGNRNFWRMFNEWFGPTSVAHYASDYYRYKHTSAFRGQTVQAELWFRNDGNTTWYDEVGATASGKTKTMLYTSNELGESSVFGANWGGNKNVPARNFTEVYESDGTTLASNQHRVLPGQIAKYEITFKVPSSAKYGTYRNYFQPSLFRNPNAFNTPKSFIDIKVVRP